MLISKLNNMSYVKKKKKVHASKPNLRKCKI